MNMKNIAVRHGWPRISTLVKSFACVAGLWLMLQGANAALFLNEPFNYAAAALGISPANGTWDTNTMSAINVTAANLTGPAGFPASTGSEVTITSAGHDKLNYNKFVNSGTITSGSVYACFLLKISSSGSMPSSGNGQIFPCPLKIPPRKPWPSTPSIHRE